eukprot:gene15473-17051_t
MKTADKNDDWVSVTVPVSRKRVRANNASGGGGKRVKRGVRTTTTQAEKPVTLLLEDQSFWMEQFPNVEVEEGMMEKGVQTLEEIEKNV